MTSVSGQSFVQAAASTGVRGWILGACFPAFLISIFPSVQTERAEIVLRTTFRLPDSAQIKN